MTRAIELRDVSVWRPAPGGPVRILDRLTLTVGRGERWAVLGPNGSGKTTLLNVLGAVEHPSAGEVEILGRRFGHTDMAALRATIGFVDPLLARRFAPGLTARQVAVTGAAGTILCFEEHLTGERVARAGELLERMGCAAVAGRAFERCSEGERKRVLLARALMRDPDLLVLDEPAAGLDLPGRELLVAALDGLAGSHPGLTTVIVTHHLEELPATTSHALLLREGRAVAAGPVEEALTDGALHDCFGIRARVRRDAGRWSVTAA